MAAHNSTKPVQYREHPSHTGLIVGTDGSVHREIRPDTRLIGADGNDWSWAFVIFREISGCPGYRVGSDGSVWSCRDAHGRGLTDNWRRLKAHPTKRGNYRVQVSVERKMVRLFVHKLVLETFIGLRPEGSEACHFPDPSRANNRITNLRWGTSKENEADKIAHGTYAIRPGLNCPGGRGDSAKLNTASVLEIRSLSASGHSDRTLASRFGVSRATIYDAVHKRKWAHI
jgi:hypothetical protein